MNLWLKLSPWPSRMKTNKWPGLSGHVSHYMVIFQFAMLVYQRVNLHFPMGFPMIFLFSHGFSYGFPMVFLFSHWFSYGFPMVFLFSHWYSYGFPIFPLVFLWFSYGIPLHGKNNSHNCAIGAAPELSPTTWI
jgi:hypothetical protein